MEIKMKKIISILLAVMVLAIPMVSCANGGAEVAIPEGMVLASGDNSAYYLFIPQNWKAVEGYSTYGGTAADGSNVVVSTYTAADIGIEETTATTEAEETTAASDTTEAGEALTGAEKYIAEYWAMCKVSFAKELRDFAIESEGKATKLDGKAAGKFVYTASFEGVKYKMQMTVAYSGGLMYIVTYTAKADNYDSHATEVDKILSEFKFK